MDQKLDDEFRMEPRVRRRRKKAPLPFLEKLGWTGADVRWYYDIRLWSPLILLLLILALLPGKQKTVEPVATVPETIETTPVEETEPAPVVKDPDAEALARLADSVGAGRSVNVKTIIMWIAINRAEDRANGYGQSLIEEINRPSQWQGYDEHMVYSAETYDLALSVLETQRTGGLRPLDSDMLWLVLNDNGSVTVRNQFTATANQKWREKTVE